MIAKKNPFVRMLLPALLALALPALTTAQVTIDVSVNTPPPELPAYDQPPIPGDGYVWTPGFWSWSEDDQDYYWVPGTWVPAPQPDFLWTPGYWGFESGLYLWHGGYWGPHVGFYGGVNYGYGYGGNGYEGGYWQGGHLFYNRSVTNINNVHITNVYNKTVINNVTVNRTSFNGGNGGTRATPTAADQAALREHHIDATSQQRAQVRTASSTPSLRASQNQGHPPVAATARAGAFSGAGVVAAKRGGTVNVMHSGAPQGESGRPAGQFPGTQHSQTAPTRPMTEGQSARENENAQRDNAQRDNAQREAPVRAAPPPPAQHVNTPPPPAPHAAPPPRPAEHPQEHADEHDHH